MAIPEPKFEITVFQLESILKELKIDTNHISTDRVEVIKELRGKLFEHLDTI